MTARPYLVATAIAIVIAISAFVYKFVFTPMSDVERVTPTVGAAGSTHAHASMLIMVGDRIINFCDPKFMLKSDIAHFEENNCHVVHKHATGVTLHTFLPSIGVELDNECLKLPTGERVCNEGVRRLRVIYNGKEILPEDLQYREIRNNDHVLINYGAEDETKLRFKYNQVPNIPQHINAPATAR